MTFARLCPRPPCFLISGEWDAQGVAAELHYYTFCHTFLLYHIIAASCSLDVALGHAAVDYFVNNCTTLMHFSPHLTSPVMIDEANSVLTSDRNKKTKMGCTAKLWFYSFFCTCNVLIQTFQNPKQTRCEECVLGAVVLWKVVWIVDGWVCLRKIYYVASLWALG